jgi:4'-phosphopantetheinyl transferase
MSHDFATAMSRIVLICDPAESHVPLMPDEIAVWVLPLDDSADVHAEARALLTSEEQSRAERYRSSSARRQFAATRALLRRILGAHLAISPLEVPIQHAGAGKPTVLGTDLHFNVTHTEGLALVALAHRAVGIDVERVRQMANAEGLVARFFSPRERDQFLSLPAAMRQAGFFRGWTCKEALIKACGLGVSCLDGFDVELHPARTAALLAARQPVIVASAWSLAAWEPERGYAAALALEGPGGLRFDDLHE